MRCATRRTTIATTEESHLNRLFVHGLAYIDEHVAQYEEDSDDPLYVIQDANYNVVAMTDSNGVVDYQYAYYPYGEFQAVENGAGVSSGNRAALAYHQGLWLDRETGNYYNRNRYYIVRLGRFGQRDPSGTTLLLVTTAAVNGQPMSPSSCSSSEGLYQDGLNVYEYLTSAPTVRLDPMGLCTKGATCYELDMRATPGRIDPSAGATLAVSVPLADAYIFLETLGGLTSGIKRITLMTAGGIKQSAKGDLPGVQYTEGMVHFIAEYARRGSVGVWYKYKCKVCLDPWWWTTRWATAIDKTKKWIRCPVLISEVEQYGRSFDPGQSELGWTNEMTTKMLSQCAEKIPRIVKQHCAATSECD